MAEAESVCNRVALIDHGRVIAHETPRTLSQLIAQSERVKFEGGSEETVTVRNLPAVTGVEMLSGGGRRAARGDVGWRGNRPGIADAGRVQGDIAAGIPAKPRRRIGAPDGTAGWVAHAGAPGGSGHYDSAMNVTHIGAYAEIAMIGGSGFYSLPGLTEIERVAVTTPLGEPSAEIAIGTLHGRRVAFLARHGMAHHILPSELPARANIWALKSLGVSRVLAIAAVGSLQPQYEPMHAVIPDQMIDRTHGRASTFFGDGVVAHISFGEPYCGETNASLALAAETAGVVTHRGGTLVVTDGPAFSTRAESQMYRARGGAER